jgi:hypothetical protein
MGCPMLSPSPWQSSGLRRFRLRGLGKVNMEGLLIAAGQNLKRRLAASGGGRRFAPSGSITGPVPSSPVRAPASKVVL